MAVPPPAGDVKIVSPISTLYSDTQIKCIKKKNIVFNKSMALSTVSTCNNTHSSPPSYTPKNWPTVCKQGLLHATTNFLKILSSKNSFFFCVYRLKIAAQSKIYRFILPVTRSDRIQAFRVWSSSNALSIRHLILKQLNDPDIQEQTTKLNKEAKVPSVLADYHYFNTGANNGRHLDFFLAPDHSLSNVFKSTSCMSA